MLSMPYALSYIGTAVSKLRHKILTDKALSVGVHYKG